MERRSLVPLDEIIEPEKSSKKSLADCDPYTYDGDDSFEDNPLEGLGEGAGGQVLYRRAYDKVVRNMRLLGYSAKNIAEVLGVKAPTLQSWRTCYPSFANAWWSGGDIADAKVARALFKRAIGYRHPDTKLFYDRENGGIVSHDVIKYYPPDTVAGQYWLNNRQPTLWKSSTSTALTNPDGSNLPPPPSINVLVIEGPEVQRPGVPPTVNVEIVDEPKAESTPV